MDNNAYYSQSRKEMLKFIPQNAKRILEVGCGEGIFLSQIKEKLGAEVWGVEMNDSSVKQATKVVDHLVIGDYTQLYKELPTKSFDCIIFNDVIEHFSNPWEVLIHTKELLSENGVVVSSIPNFLYVGNLLDVVLNKDFRYREEGGILDKTHMRFYTSKSIRRMFEETGYEIVQQEGARSCESWKEKLLITLSCGLLSDSRYKVCATVSRLKK